MRRIEIIPLWFGILHVAFTMNDFGEIGNVCVRVRRAAAEAACDRAAGAKEHHEWQEARKAGIQNGCDICGRPHHEDDHEEPWDEGGMMLIRNDFGDIIQYDAIKE